LNVETREAEQRQLEERILDADARGDTRELQRLQAQYRTGGYAVTRIHRDATATLAPTRRRSPRAAAVPHSRSLLRDEPVVPTVAPIASTVLVVFSAGARQAIIDAHIDEGFERGGWLVGRFAGGGLVVEQATLVRLPYFPYQRTTVRLPREDLELWNRHFSAAGWRVCGDWHLHPEFRPEGQGASEGDRRGWQAMADARRHPWLGVIVSACGEFRDGGTDWRWPRYAGWLAHPGRTVLDPVHLELSED
jgi:hypothetical protein